MWVEIFNAWPGLPLPKGGESYKRLRISNRGHIKSESTTVSQLKQNFCQGSLISCRESVRST